MVLVGIRQIYGLIYKLSIARFEIFNASSDLN